MPDRQGAPMTGWPVLSAAEVRAAEQAIFDGGMPVIDLMERAAARVVEAIEAHMPTLPVLILCGPGNNGGDGYVTARLLRSRGREVTVAACCDPKSETARIARQRWTGPVEPIDSVTSRPLLVDALFGIGLTRPLAVEWQNRLAALAEAADKCIAIDLPSGVSTDDGRLLGHVPRYDLTVALGTLKPAHVRDPGKGRCGRVVVGDIGLVERRG